MTKVDITGDVKPQVDIKTQVTERLQALQRASVNGQAQSATPQPTIAPSTPKGSKPALYELDRYVKFRDPLMLVGIGLVLYGVAQFSIPATFILAGITVLGISWMMAR